MKNLHFAFWLALAAWFATAHGVGASEATPNPHPDFEVTVIGHGRPVVFIPGLATPGSIWQPIVTHLKATCECHVLTVAGFGGTKPTGTDPLLPPLLDEIIAYLRDNKIEHPVIVGHSFGGLMALSVAIAAPDVPGRLVLVDATPFMGAILNPGASVEEIRAEFAPRAARVSAMTAEEFMLTSSRSCRNGSDQPKLPGGWRMKTGNPIRKRLPAD